MPIRLCNTCRQERATNRGRCASCASTHRKTTRSPFDSFYASRPWRLARRRQLHDHPLCQVTDSNGHECGEIADSVHHKQELTKGGAPRDPANLLSTCRACHAAIHMQRRGGIPG